MNFHSLTHALVRQPELWNAENIRTTFPGSPHRDVADIVVRFNDLASHKSGNDYTSTDGSSIMDQHESIWFPAANCLPIKPLLFDLMRSVEGERLGRVVITRLAPGCAIHPHEDSGDHAAYYTRYQCMLQCLPGVIFSCGEEQVQMKTGDIWFFRNECTHQVVNNSADDRIALIVDVRHGS